MKIIRALSIILAINCLSGLFAKANNVSPGIQCTEHAHCKSYQSCQSGKCQNPCPEACGTHNKDRVDCVITNHIPVCTCRKGFQYDNDNSCVPDSSASTGIACTANSHCGYDSSCVFGRCANQCPQACGSHNIGKVDCVMVNNAPVCRCRQGFVYDNYMSCVTDPCLTKTCGVNAVCELVQLTPKCTCKPKFTGDPVRGCVPQARDSTYTKQFYIRDKRVSWIDAVADCHSRNMWLATISNRKEQNMVNDLIVQTNGIVDDVWISLIFTSLSSNNCKKKENYVWMASGSELDFSYWKNKKPCPTRKKRCVLSSTDKWWFTDCTTKHYFVCEYFLNSS